MHLLIKSILVKHLPTEPGNQSHSRHQSITGTSLGFTMRPVSSYMLWCCLNHLIISCHVKSNPQSNIIITDHFSGHVSSHSWVLKSAIVCMSR